MYRWKSIFWSEAIKELPTKHNESDAVEQHCSIKLSPRILRHSSDRFNFGRIYHQVFCKTEYFRRERHEIMLQVQIAYDDCCFLILVCNSVLCFINC